LRVVIPALIFSVPLWEQGLHTKAYGRFPQQVCIGTLEDELAHFIIDDEQFINPGPSIKSGECALFATLPEVKGTSLPIPRALSPSLSAMEESPSLHSGQITLTSR